MASHQAPHQELLPHHPHPPPLLPCLLPPLRSPIVSDLATKVISISSLDPGSPEYTAAKAAILNDLKEFAGLEVIFAAATFVISTLVAIALIYAFSLACSGEFLSIKHFLRGLVRRLKGPFITNLYVSAFSLGYVSFLLAIFAVLLLGGKRSVVVTVLAFALLLLGFLLYNYLAMVWLMSVVASVVEEGCYGLAAVTKAAEVVQGRRRQGLVLMLVDGVVGGVLFAAYKIMDGYVSPSSSPARMAVGLVFVAFFDVMMAAFGWSLAFVFYHECKSSRGEAVEAALDGNGNGGFLYGSVPTFATQDEV